MERRGRATLVSESCGLVARTRFGDARRRRRTTPAPRTAGNPDTTARLGTGSIERLFDTLKAQVAGKRIETTLGDKPVGVHDRRHRRPVRPLRRRDGAGQRPLAHRRRADVRRSARPAPHRQRTQCAPGRPSTRSSWRAPLEVVVVADWPQTTALLKHYADKVEIEPLGEQRLRVRYNGTRDAERMGRRPAGLGRRAHRTAPLAAGWGRWLRRAG